MIFGKSIRKKESLGLSADGPGDVLHSEHVVSNRMNLSLSDRKKIAVFL